MALMKKGTFNEDHDFFEIGNSPSKFVSSDDEDNDPKIEFIKTLEEQN